MTQTIMDRQINTRETLDKIKKELEQFTTLATKLVSLHQRCDKTTMAIDHHLKNGDLSDAKANTELWHDLNNTQHVLNQYKLFVSSQLDKYAEESTLLMEKLRNFRPVDSHFKD